MDTAGNLSDFFEDSEFARDDIFGILEGLDDVSDFNQMTPAFSGETAAGGGVRELSEETEVEGSLSPPRNCKRQKTNGGAVPDDVNPSSDEQQPRMSHITVERNRRKQMNGHLSVLRSLMPCFYVKRGDQASIIGGVVDYITELQQVVESLEAKKQRKVYNEVLLSPRKPGLLSPRISYPISPTTPQPTTTSYNRQPPTVSAAIAACQLIEPPSSSSCSPATTSSSSSVDSANELAANSKSEIAEVEVKFSGENVVVKTVSPHIPGQAVKIISALEDLSLEILHVSITAINDHTMLNSFTIKIGIECQLSAEDLAQQIQQTFC
ncbi:transcription factor SPEECHLESS [Ipomoea triloba]|uniref:transcription factor SPEECHLESS n=1 Tax=Ipomoea triloba TaxID=35885 RepID=UPI00125E6E43|nr:transcription factor SPEECHLESS [Ipomoea triloba]